LINFYLLTIIAYIPQASLVAYFRRLTGIALYSQASLPVFTPRYPLILSPSDKNLNSLLFYQGDVNDTQIKKTLPNLISKIA